MKLLMTADTVGGVWTYALELAHALDAHGVRVALATMGAPLTDAQWRETRHCPNLDVYDSRYRLEWMDDPWEDVERAGEWLLALERRIRPDIVHLNGYVHGALPWNAPALVVGHSCVLSWWKAVKGEGAPPEWDRYRDAVERGLRGAGRIGAPTAAMLAALEAHYGRLRRGVVLPNGRDAARFAPSEKEPLIFSAGRLWDEAKNVAALARVAGELPWPVHVAGDAASPDGSAAALPGVHMLGKLAPDALARWMGRAAIYCLPARYEPFGLSALEAALSGCALVLGDIPSLREVWGDAALYVPPDDPDALRAVLHALIDDDSLRARYRDAALKRAAEYTPRRMAAAYLNVYADLATHRRESLSCVS